MDIESFNSKDGSLVEQLIDCSNLIEETNDHTNERTQWSERALDLLISIIKNIHRGRYQYQFPTKRHMFQTVRTRMTEKGFDFSVSQIETKWLHLRKMYLSKKVNNEDVEPELMKLFEEVDCHASTSVTHINKKQKLDETPPIYSTDHENDEFESRTTNIVWTPMGTKVFLDLLQEMKPQVGQSLKTKKEMWAKIRKELEVRGFCLTQTQIENKWKALVRNYRLRMEQLRNGRKMRQHKHHSTYKTWSKLFSSIDDPKPTGNELDYTLQYDDEDYANNDNQIGERNVDDPFDDYGMDNTGDTSHAPAEENSYAQQNIKPETVICDDVGQSSLQYENEEPEESEQQQQTHSTSHISFNRIADEISIFRTESLKLEREKIQLKKHEIQAYKERTTEISKLGKGFSELMHYLREKSSEGNF